MGKNLVSYLNNIINPLDIKEDAEDEEDPIDDDEEEPEPPRVLNDILKPDTVILLEATKEYMMKFIDQMSEEEVQSTH